MKVRGTDFVMYQVSDLKRAAAFYRETLGLSQEMCSEEWKWAEFNCGNVTLALNGGIALPERIAGGRVALAVDDVIAASAELKSQGVRFELEPTDYSVCHAAVILDPDGNAIVLHQRANGTFGQNSETEEQVAAAIIAMERAALDRWGKGDPSGFLEISAPDVVYFDNTIERRLDGLATLTSHYEKLRGQIFMDRYELVNPNVQLSGDVAVLTFNFIGYATGEVSRWNCTEVFRRTASTWRIIQTHWSPTFVRNRNA
jgi:catechol 2,3-dioxygenase-like lactoylglutathione lyase family enzyme